LFLEHDFADMDKKLAPHAGVPRIFGTKKIAGDLSENRFGCRL
jgi:hypothetical protein